MEQISYEGVMEVTDSTDYTVSLIYIDKTNCNCFTNCFNRFGFWDPNECIHFVYISYPCSSFFFKLMSTFLFLLFIALVGSFLIPNSIFEQFWKETFWNFKNFKNFFPKIIVRTVNFSSTNFKNFLMGTKQVLFIFLNWWYIHVKIQFFTFTFYWTIKKTILEF